MASLRLKSLLFVIVISYVVCSRFLAQKTEEQPSEINLQLPRIIQKTTTTNTPVTATDPFTIQKNECCEMAKQYSNYLQIIKGIAESCLRDKGYDMVITGYC